MSHYLFEARFGRPGKGNDKGKVEGLVGYVRRNFLVPIPRFDSFDSLNRYLTEHCQKRRNKKLRSHKETIGERFDRDCQGQSKNVPAWRSKSVPLGLKNIGS